ncbi:MAG TPA: insulinase family protein, partial [Pyrinomonadaceae bacterium]|nr:insulinase family protein [Pyrinomonadaceae bacterium]
MTTINKVSLAKQSFFALLLLTFSFSFVLGQTEQPPAPAAPKSVTVPAVKETKLKNGLGMAVIERKSSPLVTVYLLVRSGASSESSDKAGLANLTADMLTKGTKTRTATQIAEEMEFLGGSLNSGASWNSSFVSITVTPDKLDKAMAIMADVVLNPAFKQEELDLLKTQALDGLTYNLKQPSFLANYVASKYSFGEHPAGGTPTSINSITPSDVAEFHSNNYLPNGSVLIFSGDISSAQAMVSSQKVFGIWKRPNGGSGSASGHGFWPNTELVKRFLVVDLPNSGQAAVSYVKRLYTSRIGKDY